jgi:polysaccharide pyruvyl transferase WcaK-like protein
MLGKPTIAISYGQKHDSIMADNGVPEFCLQVKELESRHLIDTFLDLDAHGPEIAQKLTERRSANAKLVAEQFDLLSTSFL